MKDRPIIFNADMVRAVLDGRKTQTRRMLTPHHLKMIDAAASAGECHPLESGRQHANSQSYYREWCPFGAVGDRLWVRETWSVVSHAFDDDGLMIDYVPDRPAKAVHEQPFGRGYYSGHAIYAADGGFTWGDDDGCVDGRSCWKPSIHMPRWASRITLEITGVRVERMYDISEADARAEGVEQLRGGFWRHYQPGWTQHQLSARGSFVTLWKSIYGEESWQANPWVWVIEFKRVEVE